MRHAHSLYGISGAVDADTGDAQIMYVLSNYDSDGGVGDGCGFVSLKSRPALAVTRFSQEDLVRKKVIFRHRGKFLRKTPDLGTRISKSKEKEGK